MTENNSSMKALSFDEKAHTWDEQPERLVLANAIAEAIKKTAKLSPEMRAFEYGCGTGLLGFLLKPMIGSLIMADASAGMLKVADEKIKRNNIKDTSTLCIDLAQNDLPDMTDLTGTPDQKFDLIFTQMTFHHILDYARVIEKIFEMLNPGGFFCIADLEKEDGSFHEGNETVHDGIDSELLERILIDKGFSVTGRIIAHSMSKNDRDYPIFLITAMKGT
ncbi:class I SAM-dependent DNA methyltransferase [Desulforegula conservatrix]|uniref:class I SAM-dependent DNA methyltransferase n=1 Tax=Desulforegula conservatrix TaxID=153026 RepID=UPI00041CA692|nr:methyltransferase domain-containing protein [Desulforegula conservatrix]